MRSFIRYSFVCTNRFKIKEHILIIHVKDCLIRNIENDRQRSGDQSRWYVFSYIYNAFF